MCDDKIKSDGEWMIVFLAWVVAIVATLGSLFFSEMMNFVPCTLCWYQRIFMYPLAIILFVAMISYDKSVLKYATPFVAGGLFFAIYHNLLHYGIIPPSAVPCSQGVPCSTKYINFLDFFTIPMLSLIAFSLIAILLLILKRRLQNEQKTKTCNY
jgi:disulfide bond formation protein DsbB